MGSADDLNAVLTAGPPAPGQTVALPSGNTTITTGADQTTIIGTTDPITGHNKTDVLDRNGLLIATAESDIVLGTGGLSRDTTITSIGGAVTQVRSVDDGYGHLTTWTANPDGSHSVRYADGTVVKEPAPGSNTPAEIVQLDPDGLGGHVTEYNLDGTTTEAHFRPGILNAPVTEITGPDGNRMQVVTVPGQTNGAPYSIITNPDLTRAVLQPDGTTIPIDRYNNTIGGPNYGNQFDPLTGTWRSDPITARGPILTAPDGTSTQEWTYKNRKGEQRTATATFDKNNNLTALQSGDYTGFDSSTFKTFDGITVPAWSGHADAGNVTDDSRLYWDAILTVSGLPELGYRAGLAIGARLIARELAAKGMSEAEIQLATSTLITRGATTFTGVASTATRLDETAPAFAGPGRNPRFNARPRPGGGTRGEAEVRWTNRFEGLTPQQLNVKVELVRQALLAENDVSAVQRTLSTLGVKMDKSIIQEIKQYNFNSPGLRFTAENYNSWTRLARGESIVNGERKAVTVNDVRYLVHEQVELDLLKGIEGFNVWGPEKMTIPKLAAWEKQFDKHYRWAHSEALGIENQFLADMISHVTGGSVASDAKVVAAIDPKRAEALQYWFVDGVNLAAHPSFPEWAGQAADTIAVNRAMATRLGLEEGDRITKAELITKVKSISLDSLEWRSIIGATE
ncbi:hypothetical protein GCM10027167_11680 [Nocardia heshunensis]